MRDGAGGWMMMDCVGCGWWCLNVDVVVLDVVFRCV